MSRIAVAGATGQVGSVVCAQLRSRGHQPVPLARAHGIDLRSEAGLVDALTGVASVIDVLNTAELDPELSIAFFRETTRQLLTAEQSAGVTHHVQLSVLNADRIADNGHYLGKAAQEAEVRDGPVRFTIQRAAHFHGFAAMVAGWTLREGTATVPPLLVQPVAIEEVAALLVDHALGQPTGLAPDLAGSDTHDLVDMARRTFDARGEHIEVQASWRDSPFGVSLAGEVLLPRNGFLVGTRSFDDWLASQR